jgi:hypothetical protein
LPSLLIVLTGYEVERALSVIENQEPFMVLLGQPEDATHEEFFQRSLQTRESIAATLMRARQDTCDFPFSCRDVEKCRRKLDELVWTHKESHNIFIAPMSTKLATIAAFLVAEANPEV